MIQKEAVIGALKQVVDPEIQVDIWTLELIRKLDIDEDKGLISITMTFTTPLCPFGPMLVDEVKEKVRAVEGVSQVDVVISFEPLWEPSDELKEMLGIGF